MLLWLILAFTVLPLVDLVLLFRVGRAIGAAWTIALVLGAGVLGAFLVKYEGLRTVRRVRADLGNRTMPTDALLNGVLILLGGVLLVTPGVITDVLGIALLVPPTRGLVAKGLRSYFRRRIRVLTLRSGAEDRPRRRIDVRVTPAEPNKLPLEP